MNNNNKLLDYITKYAHDLKVPKADVLYMILTGSIPAYTGHVELSHAHDLWMRAEVRNQLKKIAAAEHMSVSALIWNTVTGKHAPLKLAPLHKDVPKARPFVVVSVYAPVAAWVSKVTHALNISQTSLLGQCLRDNKCFTHICAWPELTSCKKYSTISIDRELYNRMKTTRIKGQSLSYTLYKMLGATQKPETQPKAVEAAPQAAADKAENWTVKSPVQDPAIMLADLRARCRELLLEIMEQEFERIKKTITRI